ARDDWPAAVRLYRPHAINDSENEEPAICSGLLRWAVTPSLSNEAPNAAGALVLPVVERNRQQFPCRAPRSDSGDLPSIQRDLGTERLPCPMARRDEPARVRRLPSPEHARFENPGTAVGGAPTRESGLRPARVACGATAPLLESDLPDVDLVDGRRVDRVRRDTS